MRFRFQGCVAVLALAAGCASPASTERATKAPSHAESAAMAARAGLSPGEINLASEIYNLKCAKCHKFYNPADYDNAEWKSWMRKMSRKARLKPEQEQLLSRYLAVTKIDFTHIEAWFFRASIFCART